MRIAYSFVWTWLLLLFLLKSFEGIVVASAIDTPSINPFQDVSVGQSLTLRPLVDGVFVETSPGVKPGGLVACMRVRIQGIPRFSNVKKISVITRVKVQYATDSLYWPAVPKVEVCLHRNGSMEVAQCSQKSWRSLENGFWSGPTSPFLTNYVDIRTSESFSDVAISISAEEGPYLEVNWFFKLQQIGEFCKFFDDSAKGMKLLPTGRKSSLWLLVYSTLLGLGSAVVHYFGGLVSTFLKDLGLGDDMFNPVAVFLGLGVLLIGAWLGFWGVRKFVLAEDGSVDFGVANFVKWAIRLIGCTMLLQASYDVTFSVLALALGSAVVWLMGKLDLQNFEVSESIKHQWMEYWNSRGVLAWIEEILHEFRFKSLRNASRPSLTRGAIKKPFTRTQANSLQNLPGKEALTRWEQVNALSRRHLKAPAADLASPSPPRRKEFPSTFHKTPDRTPLSSTEYKATDITEEAVGELVRSKDFQLWWATNVVSNDRVSIAPNEHREERPEHEVEATAYLPQDKILLSRNPDYLRRYQGPT
ncbi:uncharacterized protein [Physcomitrium patens]|uniref:uncharacterized protein isoform X4 n=1 Tax=Physcomitrium patens TaxID=3218 RepID=UPI000D17E0AA|nr:uncharacterized protein LOC112287426 isoform X4 [Physcomitrium patens]|eukprot:XP_024386150.1 uncharacterized protein LOC112287426 isoform X4 [Physcomitrella patens]